MILIKPHHFIDIIKLYGAGIEQFVPDEAFGHDFYKVANEIVHNPDCELQITIYGDDICKPCNRYNGLECTDPLDKIAGYDRKEIYNQALDSRLTELLQLDTKSRYTVRELLQVMQENPKIIFRVWLEEDSDVTEKRNTLFQKGCEKLHKNMRKE
ncbi:MAG: DUF1284 domain-containing protein [Lachnospiraceae bacterium]|nr:DUF1284 domain-containing protein [Lachnospiraceae bacterium]